MGPTQNVGSAGGASGDSSGSSNQRGAVAGGRSSPSIAADSMDMDVGEGPSRASVSMQGAHSSPSFLLAEESIKTYVAEPPTPPPSQGDGDDGDITSVSSLDGSDFSDGWLSYSQRLSQAMKRKADTRPDGAPLAKRRKFLHD